jgi:hypothetical protein
MPNNPIGNVKGFTGEMIKNMLYVIGVGYMGGALSSMGKSSKELFPYHLNEAPYGGNVSARDDVGLLEYLWPMNSVGFPYATMNAAGEGYSSQYLKWLLETCAHSFATFRYGCSEIAKAGDKIAAKHWIGDIFRFYVMPYFLIYMMAVVHVALFALTIFVSTMYAADGYGFMYSLSPLTGWVYGFSLCEKTISIQCIIFMILLGIIGFWALFLIHIPWWYIVTVALTLYAYILLLFSPFLSTNGLQKTFQEIKSHKRSLVMMFMYFTLKSAHNYLTTPVSSGLLIGALYIVYKLFTGKMC